MTLARSRRPVIIGRSSAETSTGTLSTIFLLLLGATSALAGGPRSAMVAVPAGVAFVGCHNEVDSECEDDEKPGARIEIGAFEIDRTEVTVADYAKCVEAGACSRDGLSLPTTGTAEQPELAWTCNWGVKGREQHPINCVSFTMAESFCRWAGKRLPSAVEWERAARGTDGRRYPWGNDDVAASPQANLSDVTLLRNEPGGWGLEQFDDGFVSTAPVGLFPAGKSPVGADDMAGNVWELVANSESHRDEMRGGAWSYYPHALRTSDKAYAPTGRRNGDTGFRCAR